ncbi:MAG TPA: hypothetical protein VIW94_00665, partial [Acidimicrobiia bacterium]
EARQQLAEEQARRAVQENRSNLAESLHDSVLQTLHAIRIGADDPNQSRYLARRQERELRRTIEQWRSPYQQSFRAALLEVRDDIEDTHRVAIEAVIRDDAELNRSLALAIETAREAMTNAVKHSHSDNIAIFSEFQGGYAFIHVRDGGPGKLDADSRKRVQQRLTERVDPVGGLVDVDSTETGTEVKITVGQTDG